MLDKIAKYFGLVPKSKLRNAFNPAAIGASYARAANHNSPFIQLADGSMLRVDPQGGFDGFGYFSGYDVPTLELLRAAGGTFDPSAQQIIGQPRWHQQLYTSAATTTLTYFAAVTSGMTGNQEIAGIIPNTKHFVLRAPRFFPTQVGFTFAAASAASAAASDQSLLIFNGFFELTVISKSYLRLPLYMLPAGGGITGSLTGTFTAPANAAIASHGVADPRAVWVLTNPLLLEGNINFGAVATWSAAQTLSANATTCLVFDGQEIRPRQ